MFDPTTLTGFHTWLSLVAIVTGFGVLAGLLRRGSSGLLTAIFLASAVATDLTGYLFPVTGLLPSHVVGAVSLVVLIIALLARYRFQLIGAWRWIYAGSVVASLYLLVFVGIVQAFLKVPALHALAPTGSEPPFAVAQLAALAIFVALGIAAARHHPLEVLRERRPV